MELSDWHRLKTHFNVRRLSKIPCVRIGTKLCSGRWCPCPTPGYLRSWQYAAACRGADSPVVRHLVLRSAVARKMSKLESPFRAGVIGPAGELGAAAVSMT
jgi:hypothetical protein